jgi:hypothetical protein
MKNISVHAIGFVTKIIQIRRNIGCHSVNPQKYLSGTHGGVQAFASQPPDPSQ